MARNKSESELEYDRASTALRERLNRAEAKAAFELRRHTAVFRRFSQFRHNTLVFFMFQWLVMSAIFGILVMN